MDITQEQFNQLATKKDLQEMRADFDKKFATKDDLKNFATKDDLKNFATKEEHINLSNKTDKIIAKMIDLDERVQSIEERMVTKDEFYGLMDTVIKKLDNIEHNFAANQAAHDRFEKRITRVEKQLELKPC